jgi:polysaccharide deacetylase family protein (PEP-CTERM system associated)
MTPINPINQDRSKYFLITIDVEDWFQVENFKPWIPFETWRQLELRVEKNVHRLLDLFDSISLPSLTSKSTNLVYPDDSPTKEIPSSPKATFFVLGWIANKLPQLVREIAERGHEVSSHGCYHDLPSKMSLRVLRQDLIDSRQRLEEITGTPISGYRAPSFAIDDKILATVAEAGYCYDSSYNSFSLHGRYGKISLNGKSKNGIAHKISEKFYELPISNLNIKTLSRTFSARWDKKLKEGNSTANPHRVTSENGLFLPWGGGSYFRLIPFHFFKAGVDTILKNDGTYMLYLHPWEIDPYQPKVDSASFTRKFRHYTNLNKTKFRLKRLIENYSRCRFVTCRDYLLLTQGVGLTG